VEDHLAAVAGFDLGDSFLPELPWSFWREKVYTGRDAAGCRFAAQVWWTARLCYIQFIHTPQ
jgi:hypothetical protein